MHHHHQEAAAAAAAAAAAMIDPSGYAAAYHPYYRVAGKDFVAAAAAGPSTGVPGHAHPSMHHQAHHFAGPPPPQAHHGHHPTAHGHHHPGHVQHSQTLLDPHHGHHPSVHPHHHSLGHHGHSSVGSPAPSVASSVAAQAVAVQTRILEMRKEKSRDAARSRRGKENHEFYELAKMLPLPAAITSQLDKASIIRLTISYLKLREFSQNGEPSWSNALSSMNPLKCKSNTNLFESHQGTHILQSLDGFAFALGQDGRFLYISETVSIYLGLSQVEMTGSSIFDYTHQQDHVELAEQLGLSLSHRNRLSSPLPPGSVSSNASNDSDHLFSQQMISSTGLNDTFERQFCIRMKSTLTKRGCQHYKSSGYRVVNIVAHLRPEMLRRHLQNGSNQKIIGLVAIAIALPPPSINELRLEPDMFVTRHTLDFKIVHSEQRVTDLLSYSPDELVGRSMYSLVHAQDMLLIKKCHQDLVHKGQSMSGYYRIINKSGGYTWVQTCATLICNNPTQNPAINAKSIESSPNSSTAGPSSASNAPTPPLITDDQEQSVICVNYVLSAIEQTNVIMDYAQLGSKLPHIIASPIGKIRQASKKQQQSQSSSSSPEVLSPKLSAQQHQQHSHQQQSPAIASQQQPSNTPHEPSRAENIKRRRLNSSPVRPWKSPSPTPPSTAPTPTPHTPSVVEHSQPHLLRHISVIRETPPAILKPHVIPATPYHPYHHHLVDQYAAAYHLYKTGPNNTPVSPQTTNTPNPHHWGTYG